MPSNPIHLENVSRVEIYRMPFPEYDRDSARAKVEELNKPYADDHAKYGVVFFSRKVKGKAGKRWDILHKRFPHRIVESRSTKIISGVGRNIDYSARRRVLGGHEVTSNINDPDGWQFVPDQAPINQTL